MRISPLMSSAAAATTISTSSTVIVGLNAALQKRFVLAPPTTTTTPHHLIPGNVHRAAYVSTGVGGKGQDVFCTLRCLEYYNARDHPQGNIGQQLSTENDASRAIGQHHALRLAQFIGTGPAGDQVYELLQTMSANQNDDGGQIDDLIGPTTVRTISGMRTCTSIVATDCTTELVEPSGIVTPDELNQLLSMLAVRRNKEHITALCFMGSMPPGCPLDTYANIYRTLAGAPETQDIHAKSPICVIDSVLGLDELLPVLSGPTILKINASELRRLVSTTLEQIKSTTSSSSADVHSSTTANVDVREADGVPREAIVESLVAFFHQYKIMFTRDVAMVSSTSLKAIALTDGKHAAYMGIIDQVEDGNDSSSQISVSFSLYQLSVASLTTSSAVLYPIGAGDSVAAGTLAAWRYLHPGLDNTRDIVDDREYCLPIQLRDAINDQNRNIQVIGDAGPHTASYLTSFAFGLACGSASCLNEENSVINIPDVLQLFRATKQVPTLISTHSVYIQR